MRTRSPIHPSSVLALHIAPDGTGTNMVLNWAAATGKTYQILSTTNLGDPVWPVFPASIQAIGSQRYFDIPATDSQRYFRILCGD